MHQAGLLFIFTGINIERNKLKGYDADEMVLHIA